jgi:hypothetical protein
MRGLNDTDTGCTNCMWSQEFYWRDEINGSQDLGQVWLIVPNGTMNIAGWGRKVLMLADLQIWLVILVV